MPETIYLNDKGLELMNDLHSKVYEGFKKESLEGNKVKKNGLLTNDGLLTGKEDADVISPTFANLKDTVNQYEKDGSESNLKENVEETFEDYEHFQMWDMIKEIKTVLKTTAIKIIKIVSGWFAGWVKSL